MICTSTRGRGASLLPSRQRIRPETWTVSRDDVLEPMAAEKRDKLNWEIAWADSTSLSPTTLQIDPS